MVKRIVRGILNKLFVGKTLAKVPWTIEPGRDKLINNQPRTMKGKLVLKEFSAFGKYVGGNGCVFQFFDGNNHFPVALIEEYKQIPEFIPFLPKEVSPPS